MTLILNEYEKVNRCFCCNADWAQRNLLWKEAGGSGHADVQEDIFDAGDEQG